MASGTAQHGSPAPKPSGARRTGRVVEYQQYIETQLGRTRRRVQWVDLWTSLTTLAVGFTAYLLLAAVIDHWIAPGGLGTASRWLLLVGLTIGIVVHLAARVAPVFIRRVNPVYAAAAIEQGGRMKNTLINFLLLRRVPEALPDGVLEAIKEQAAVRLSAVPDDAPVDRTALIRWFYVLAAILIAAIGYALASPKDSWRSIRRVMSPWLSLTAPTRVRFESVAPGNVDKRRDDVVEVSVRVAGLRAADAVTLYYSASGNAADDVALPMHTDENRYLWKVVLPPGSEGLKQDLFYHVRAGDAESPQFRIRVLATPVMNVRSVRYDYPSYTGLPPRVVERQGDLQALEGTKVTLTAEANQPIRGAYVGFDQARNKDIELRPNGLEAVGGFELALGKDRTTPVHSSYVLRFTNIDGEENPKPVEHSIGVVADQAPEVRVVEPNSPPEKELSLPLGGLMKVTLAARDPDFQLGDLTVVFERATGAPLREERLLAEPRYGEFSNTLVFNAERYNLKVGDKFTFRGRAADNKSPKPNVVETPRYAVVVVSGEGGQQQNPQQQQQPDKREGQPPAEPQNREQSQSDRDGRPGKNEQPQPNDGKQPPEPNQKQGEGRTKQDGAAGEGQPPSGERKTGDGGTDGGTKDQQPAGPDQRRQSGEQGDQPKNEQRQEPIDPNVDPGKAFDELNKHFEQKDKERPGSGDRKQEPENQGRESGEKKQDQPREGETPAEPQNGANQKNDDGGYGQQQQQQPGSEQNQNSGKQQSGGGQPKGDESSGAGKPDGGSGQKQSGPQQGSNADERKTGGSDQGVGRQGAEGSGEKAPGGQGRNQPTKKPGDEAAQPGGQAGAKNDRPPQGGPAERRNGENQGGREAGQRPDPGDDSKQQTGDNQATDPNDRMKQGSGKQQGGEPINGESGKQPGTNQPGERANEGPSSDGQRPNAQSNESRPGVKRDSSSSDSGNGGKSGGDESKPVEQPKRPGEPNPDGAQGKPSDNEKQPGGNTKNPGGMQGPAPKQDGSPQQQEVAKPRDKTGKAESDNSQEGKEEKSAGGNSQHESDAQGQTSGDRAGDGEDGAGMKSPKKGTGAAGQNTPGEQGGGTSSQEGNQATSDKGGDKARGNDPSKGKPSERKGEGTQSQQAGDKSGGDSQGTSKDGAPSNSGNGDNQNNATPGGGNPNAPRNAPPEDTRTVAPPADEANLDYTRQVTELTLDRLKQQLDNGDVDPELLKRFTSREALEEFVRKWESMRQAARDPGPSGDQAKQKFQETLKSLGLRPGSTSQGASTSAGDDYHNVRGGRRSEPPAKYADQYRAYTTGVGQGEK